MALDPFRQSILVFFRRYFKRTPQIKIWQNNVLQIESISRFIVLPIFADVRQYMVGPPIQSNAIGRMQSIAVLLGASRCISKYKKYRYK